MGTRGFVGFVVGGEVKITYNHFDSYPEELGAATYRTLKAWLSTSEIEKRVQQAVELRMVDEDSEPTPGDRLRYAPLRAEGKGEAGSWYELLRNTQGDIEAILDAGVAIDAGDEWPRDSLFCEWGYLIDFDRRKLEVYEGFQRERPAAGRWAKAEPLSTHIGGTYYPVGRIVEFDLGALPGSAAEFVDVVRANSSKAV